MNIVLDIAWLLVKILSYGGLAVALLGVAIFGWHFVRINARAGRGETSAVPAASWRGPGATLGLKILLLGAGLQVASFFLSAVLPPRL